MKCYDLNLNNEPSRNLKLIILFHDETSFIGLSLEHLPKVAATITGETNVF